MASQSDPETPRESKFGMAELGTRLKANDESVCEEVLRQVYPKAGGTVLSRFPSLREQDCDDIISIALHRLWTTRAAYDPKLSSLDTWFIRLSLNAAADELRRRQKLLTVRFDENSGPDQAAMSENASDFEAPVYPMNEEPTLASAFDPPVPLQPHSSSDSNNRQAMIDLEDILSNLPRTKSMILRAWVNQNGDGTWASDIAQELGKKPGAVRVIFHRTVRHITVELEKRGYEIEHTHLADDQHRRPQP